MRKLISYIAMLFLPLHFSMAETMQYSFTFSLNDLSITSTTIDDSISYNIISLYNCDHGMEIGCPDLPVKYISQELPSDAYNINVSANIASSSSIVLPHKIMPVQAEQTTSVNNNDISFTYGNNDIYSSDSYPIRQVEIYDVSTIRGKCKLAVIALYPVIYHPTRNSVDFLNNVSLTLTYSRDPEMSGFNRLPPANNINLPFYEYCIITSRALSHAFTRLVSWKRNKGIDAGVVCIEDIINNPNIIGDTISHLYDDAGKLRQYLQHAYDWGNTKYVLMGGNDRILPIRYGTSFSVLGDEEAKHVPSDFYFAELDANWNVNNDEFLGEKNLDDYGTELYIGRLLCCNEEEISNYTDKLLRYELNPGNGDHSYLSKALMTQADQMQLGQEAQFIADGIRDIFSYINIIEESPGEHVENTTCPTGNDVIEEMNNRYGFYSWFNHGNPTSISVCSQLYGENPINGVTCITGDIPWIVRESANGLDCLTNKDYPAIVYSVACTITPFDTYDPRIESFPNMGQSFTLGKDYGGPALIGNTRCGYVTRSTNFQNDFNQYIRQSTIGESLANAKLRTTGQYKHHHALVVNIIGCPELRIWTAQPTLPSPTIIESIMNKKFCTGDSIYEIGTQSIIDGQVVHEAEMNIHNYCDNSIYTIHGNNILPTILPLYIQNVAIDHSGSYLVSDVICGQNQNHQGQGDVIFESGIDFAIEKSGYFKINSGTKINKGAKFSVKNSNINYNRR